MAKRAFKLDKMSLPELVQLRDKIESSLKRKVAEERKMLQIRIDALSAIEGGPSTPPRAAAKQPQTERRKTNGVKNHPLKGRKATAKYRGPNGETWAGRGLKPRWLAALEKKGKKPEQFLIARSS